MNRTPAGSLRHEHVGQSVTLCGWVQKQRDFGELIFVDLRDRSGICQVVFRPEVDPTSHEKAKQIRSEDVIA
ncbi:MAG TPA: OB-fold nucleic acid binding domain-containing protein, partial [Thermoanaerobaculia bacterium]|nr:OB-fold nucleic acid binding domain-containing protein [Thermoanaerobaculia bacterium]